MMTHIEDEIKAFWLVSLPDVIHAIASSRIHNSRLGGQTFTEWTLILWKWDWTSEGLQKQGGDNDVLIMLRLPVVSGAVKIEHVARTERPGDLHLYTFRSARRIFLCIRRSQCAVQTPLRYEYKPGALGG